MTVELVDNSNTKLYAPSVRRMLRDKLEAASSQGALAVARGSQPLWPQHPDIAYLAGRAFKNASCHAEASAAFEAAVWHEGSRPQHWKCAIAASIAIGNRLRGDDLAIRAAERFPADYMLQLKAARALIQDHPERAERHVVAGLAVKPADATLLRLHGKLLLLRGRSDDAMGQLSKAKNQRQNDPIASAALAAAMRKLGDFSGAAAHLRDALRISPQKPNLWRRLAADAKRSGDDELAAAAFSESVRLRQHATSESLANRLKALRSSPPAMRIKKQRLDWAWDLRSDPGGNSREQWEQAVAWGAAADKMLFNQVECGLDLDEVLQITTLAGGELFAAANSQGRGVLLAGAHVGPNWASPPAIHRAHPAFKWLANSSTSSNSPITRHLISPLDQSGGDCVRAMIGALRRREVVMLLADGTGDTPDFVEFEGQRIAVTTLCSQLIVRTGAVPAFGRAEWNRERVAITIIPMALPAPKEDADAYHKRWLQDYLDNVRVSLAGAPENLNCEGGLWKHIRAANRHERDPASAAAVPGIAA